MPVTNGAAVSPAVSSTSTQSQREFCDFLKRKYPEDNDNELSNHKTASPPSNAAYTENHHNNGSNVWKKPRHIEENNAYELSPNTTSIDAYNNQQISTTTEEYPQPNSGSPQAPIANTPEVTAETSAVSSSGTFNIIANSTAFINDLFTYDANLLVPTSSTESELCQGEPTFTTPSNICVNTTHQYEEDNTDHWQATDLLELDHRYNSSLQTEITQLNPTVSLKPHEETLVSLAEHRHNSNMAAQRQQHSSQSPSLTPVKTDLPHGQKEPSSLDNETDFEDRNLSWLLNFKFDEFPHLNPDVAGVQGKPGKGQLSNGSTTAYKTMIESTHKSNQARERSKSPKNSNKTGKKFEELVMEVVTSDMDGSDMVVAENVVIEDTTSPQRA